MSTKLFVGNLSFNATENQLQDMFAAHGTVLEVDLIMDKFSGRPRGFAFVTMENKEGADAAVQAINGKSIDGRALTVNEARPKPWRAGCICHDSLTKFGCTSPGSCMRIISRIFAKALMVFGSNYPASRRRNLLRSSRTASPMGRSAIGF